MIQRDEVESVLGVRQWHEATTYDELVAGIGNSNPEANPEAATAAAAVVSGLEESHWRTPKR